MTRPLIAAALLAATTATGAAAADRNFPVGSFNALSVGGSSEVRVVTGKVASVRATGDEAALDRLDIRVEDGKLVIGNKKRMDFNWGMRGKTSILITVPMLRSAEVAGSGTVTVDRIDTPEFFAGVAGSGNLHLPSLRSPTTRFSVAGSGQVDAAGSSTDTRASVAGSGDVNIGGLKTTNLTVSVSGSGNIDAFATSKASVSVAGSGDVRIRGGAKCAISKAGSGSVDCG